MAREMANERMLTLMDQMPYDIDLATYAVQHGLTVKETDFFPKDEAVPGFGSDEQLLRSINVLEKGEVSDIIEQKVSFTLSKLLTPRIPISRKSVKSPISWIRISRSIFPS